MTNHDFPPGAPMDATESLVREQFESAVAGLHLDVPSLVNGGTTAGLRLRRRRRFQQVGAGVASVAVVAAGGLLGIHGGLFDNSAPPANHGVTELVPSNPHALAAAVIADLPAHYRVVKNGGIADPAPHQVMEADLDISGDGLTAQVNTLVVGNGVPSGRASCRSAHITSCQTRTLPDGSHLFAGPNGPRSWLVFVTRADEAVGIQELVTTADARGPMPLSLAELEAIAADPLVGLQTSHAMVTAGASLSGFTRMGRLAEVSGSSSGSGSSGPPHRRVTHSAPPPAVRSQH